MPAAPYAQDEDRRLLAVRQSNLLGTPAEERFDKITRMARRLFDVPMACIDVAGEEIVWLKSVQGFDGLEGLRKDSYCHHTILDNKVCLISDARVDPRVCDSALAELWVFYAGVPLHFQGHRVGVLCIGDDKPRDFPAERWVMLRDLAALAEREMQEVALSGAQVKLAGTGPELAMKSRVDLLTHVWNWDAVLDLLAMERDNAVSGTSSAVLMIDLDNFQKINADHGRRAGDQVLREVAGGLRAGARPMDVVGRYGGEKFLAVLPKVRDVQEAMLIAERVRKSVASLTIFFEGAVMQVTCSIGCTISSSRDDIDLLIRRADEALVRAKEGGRNRVELIERDAG